MKAIAAAVALALAGCLPASPLPPVSEAHSFDPIEFFTGVSEGVGQLATVTGKTQTVHVTSLGTRHPDGSLTLDQHIATQGKKARDRQWIIRPLGHGRYTGSLTEAVGPVDATVAGNAMTIRYRTKDYRVRQSLVLGRDGAIHNRLDVVKWGLNVARLSETIVRK